MSHQGEPPVPRREDYDTIAPLDAGAMLRVVWHGKWIVVLAIVAGLFLGGYYAFKMTSPQFVATATLQLEAQPAHLGDVSQHWPTPATDATSLNTEVTILTSDTVLRQVTADENLLQDPEFNRYLRPVAPFALNTLRGHVRNYLAGTTDTVPDAGAIADKTVQNLRGALSANRPRDTLIFQISARSGDPAKAARLANAAAAAYIATQIDAKDDAAQAAITWLGARVQSLRNQLETQETAITGVIANAQIQEDTSFDALSNAVLQTDQERATVFAALGAFDPINLTARQTAEMAQLRNKIAVIDARRTQLGQQLAAQSAGLVQLQQMQREADATRVLYRSFLARLQETRVQRGLAYSNSRLIAPATAGHYVGPRKMLILAISAMLGGLLGLMAVAAQHLRRDGVLHPDVLHHQTGHRVLATLPARATKNRPPLLRGFGGGDDPATAQELRKIMAGLMICCQGQLPKSIMLGASRHGEGKSALALALSRGLAQRNGPVLLINADPESRTARQLLPKATGAAPHAPFDLQMIGHDAVSGCDIVQITSLDVILDAKFAEKLHAVSAPYAHVVINAPPVGAGPETQLIARHADAVVFAVRWARTPLRVVLAGLDLIGQSGAGPVGIAITHVNKGKMRSFGAILAPQTRARGIA